VWLSRKTSSLVMRLGFSRFWSLFSGSPWCLHKTRYKYIMEKGSRWVGYRIVKVLYKSNALKAFVMRELEEKYRMIMWAIKLKYKYHYVYMKFKLGKVSSFKLKTAVINKSVHTKIFFLNSVIRLIHLYTRVLSPIALLDKVWSPLGSTKDWSISVFYRRKLKARRPSWFRNGRLLLSKKFNNLKFKRKSSRRQFFFYTYKCFCSLRQMKTKKISFLVRFLLINVLFMGVTYLCYKSHVDINTNSIFSTKLSTVLLSKLHPKKKKKTNFVLHNRGFVFKPVWRLVFSIALWCSAPWLITSILGLIIRQTRKKKT